MENKTQFVKYIRLDDGKLLRATLTGVFIILIGLAIFMYSRTKPVELEVKNDVNAIVNRFPNMEGLTGVSWTAEIMGEESRLPGPSEYTMEGFAFYSSDKIEGFIDQYNMKAVEEKITFGFVPNNYEDASASWLVSKEFHEFMISPGFDGVFYLNPVNKCVYFKVSTF